MNIEGAFSRSEEKWLLWYRHIRKLGWVYALGKGHSRIQCLEGNGKGQTV